MRIWESAIILAALTACGGAQAQQEQRAEASQSAQSQQLASRDYDLSGFTTVAAEGPDDVRVTLGDSFSVRAEGPQSELDELDLEVIDDGLKIGRRDNDDYDWRRNVPRVTVYVTLPNIDAAAISGSGDMTLDRAEAETFSTSISGSGGMVIDDMRAERLDLSISGSGELSVAGTVQDVRVSIAGSGDLLATDLRAETLQADIAGSGDIAAYVTGRAQANIVGSGDINVRGGAECQSRTIGSGELICR